MKPQSYHEDFQSVSKTMLNHFVDSHKEYATYYVHRTHSPPAPKKQMLIGSAVHDILLEKFDFDKVIAVYDESCFKRDGKTREILNSLNPGPAAEFRDMFPDRYCLKPDEAQVVHDVCNAVHDHALGDLIRHPEAKFEQPIYWQCEVTGLNCRCCPDFLIDMGDHVLCYDLKVTEQPKPNDFARVANRFRYWLQDAHYSAGIQSHYKKPVQFKFWVVEAGGLCRVSPRLYDPSSRDMAMESYRLEMALLKQCYATGDWADEWTEAETFIPLNPYALRTEADMDFSDMDEEESDE
jgi:hypothetical protein